jgi:antitoxin component YwqK of YwqJK toxin-antitoxin module
MRTSLLSGLLVLPLFLSAKLLDTIPEVLYFNDNFEIRHVQQASYYGIIERFENRHFKATLFTPAKQKVAIVGYAGRERSFRDGEAIGYYPSGDTQFVVNFYRDALDGEWRSYYENGQLCDSGNFYKNMPDGDWISYYENGQPQMVVKYSARKLIQVKEEMRRMFRPTSLTGSSTVRFRGTGAIRAQQEYMRNQYQYLQQAILPASIVGRFKGLSLKRKIDLNTTQRFPYYAAPYDECLIHGLYKSYFPDGKLKDSGYSINGMRTGVWQEYTPDNKTMSRGFYKKGFKRGEWRYYNTEGKFIYLRRYNKFGKEKESITPGGLRN